MLFQSGKGPGVVTVFALEDGGSAASKGFGGFGGEGAVSRVVGNEGYKRSNGWDALSLFLSQRRSNWRYVANQGSHFQDRGA